MCIEEWLDVFIFLLIIKLNISVNSFRLVAPVEIITFLFNFKTNSRNGTFVISVEATLILLTPIF